MIVGFQPGWRRKSVGGKGRARKEVDAKRLLTTNTHRDFKGKLIVFSKPLTAQWPHSSPEWKELQHVVKGRWIIVFRLNCGACKSPHCVFQIMRNESWSCTWLIITALYFFLFVSIGPACFALRVITRVIMHVLQRCSVQQRPGAKRRPAELQEFAQHCLIQDNMVFIHVWQVTVLSQGSK